MNNNAIVTKKRRSNLGTSASNKLESEIDILFWSKRVS